MRFVRVLFLMAVFSCLGTVPTSAEFTIPDFRGAPQTTYQAWNVFTSATLPNLPDVANQNPNGSATLQELTGGSFLTSGGNIYSFAVATSFELLIPDYNLGPDATTKVVLQLRTQGATVDLASILFNGQPASSAELLYEEPLGGFGGILRDWKFEWDAVPGNVAMNTIRFSAEGSSMSLDRVALDTLAMAAAAPSLAAARVLHFGFGGTGQPPMNGLDHRTQFASPSNQSLSLTLQNIVNTNRGINGIAIDLQNLVDASDLQWSFAVSPPGIFSLEDSPIESWQAAPPPTSITVYPSQGDQGSDRIVVQWPDQAIVGRYLKIRIDVGQSQLAELYIGHLTGKTIENSSNTFTVSFADISPIRSAVGQTADGSSAVDINKDGTVSFSDISAMRGFVGSQLSRLVIPPKN